MKKPVKSREPLPGVTCSVDTCEYNNQNNQCIASKIEVAPKGRGVSEDTDCNTFTKRHQY